MWDAFKACLDHYDEALAILEEEGNKDLSEQEAIVKNYHFETATEEETEAYAKAAAEINLHTEKMANAYADVVCKVYLEAIEYDGGTLLDYFTRPSSEIEEDMTVLYPLVAALTEGQRAGLEFTTLQEMVIIAATDENGYKNASFDVFDEVSVYDGVDRAIYEKGGVGLTSDAYRQNVAQVAAENNGNGLSVWTYVSIGLTAASILALGVTVGVKLATRASIKALQNTFQATQANITNLQNQVNSLGNKLTGMIKSVESAVQGGIDATPFQTRLVDVANEFIEAQEALNAANAANAAQAAENQANQAYLARLQSRSALCNKLMIGIGVAMIILMGVTTYLTYRDMVNRYKVSFTPIPRYMVDEKDIIGYNAKGEKIVLKNQAAYYKAVFCNRKAGDEMFKNLGNIADLNGDVGQQWLALYAERNTLKAPILADSFLTSDKTEIPAGYKTGIHSFGTEAAENLNNTLYVWNSAAPMVFVYYKTEEAGAGAGAAGSVFSSGTVVLSGVAGLAVGVLATALCMKVTNKRKERKTAKA